MAKKVDPVKAKAAKQKKIAIAGGVLLLGLLAFQVPRTMKMLKGPSTATPSTPASTTATGSPALAPPTLDGGSTAGSSSGAPAGPSTATSSDGVSDPSVPLPPSSGQLVTFDRFQSKDPFKQQVQACATPTCGTSAPAAGSSGATTGTSTTTSAGGGTQASAPTAVTAAPLKRTVATISVNGTIQKVNVRRDFPAAAPVFSLVSVTGDEAMIGIAGGSLASGADTVGLKVGKTVKLQNTADHSTYVLKLLATS